MNSVYVLEVLYYSDDYYAHEKVITMGTSIEYCKDYWQNIREFYNANDHTVYIYQYGLNIPFGADEETFRGFIDWNWERNDWEGNL